MADKPQPPKDLSRDAFYEAKLTGFEDDGEEELELEPRDPEILAAEQRRAREAVEVAQASVDVDEIYRESSRKHDYDFDISDFRPQFQVKHMLMATAALAIVMALYSNMGAITAILFVVLAAVGSTLVYLNRKEQAEADLREEDRQRRYKRMQQLREAQRTGQAAEPETPIEDIREVVAASSAGDLFRFKFGKEEATIAAICAAVVLSLLSVLGPGSTALVLGLVALIGLIFEAAGFDAPRMVLLAWWFLLLIYIFVSVVAAVWERLNPTV
jgi:hypothetical protein